MDRIKISRQERVSYYISCLRWYASLDVELPRRTEAFVVTRDTTPEHFIRWFRDTEQPGCQRVTDETLYKARYMGYVLPLVKSIEANPSLQDKAFAVIPKDNYVDRPFPMIAKTRLALSQGMTFLMQLKRTRHWGDGFDAAMADKAFEQKDSRLIFRGASTGRWPKPDARHPVTGLRYRLAKQLPWLVHDARIDVKFTYFEPHVAQQDIDALLALNAVSSKIPVSDQLDCKYLLSLEGHDVASGLKWMLLSNSVVFMPRPRLVSWLMEDKLVPYRHYVPVADDLSDLSAQIDWCEANVDACHEIVANSTAFMRQFQDPDVETEISAAVMRNYGQRVRLRAKASVYPGVEAANLVLH